jgi:hypothetical protein
MWDRLTPAEKFFGALFVALLAAIVVAALFIAGVALAHLVPLVAKGVS